ncbi:hypothetical protein [Alloalcanivorax mobilis]|uniref:hypothetical protein n=1 Tax=Alloalcanivorax mobilis TaxID=2019569 RepID=UPI000C791790|nr:hypothetical protein [Alloalcanivorax mobilis]
MRKQYQAVRVECPWTGETAHLSPWHAAKFTGRSVRTAQRWAAGARPAPADLAALRLHALGIIPDDRWHHFRLRRGMLVHLDTNETWTPEQLRTSWALFQMAADYRALRRRPAAPVLHLAPQAPDIKKPAMSGR